MRWIRRLISSFVGLDRYHTQANEVNARQLRQELLSQQLDVLTRGRR